MPITDPRKKFLILTLNNVGKMFEIKKGIPPTNLYIRKKVNSFSLNFSVRLENLDENFFLIISLKKKFAVVYKRVAPMHNPNTISTVPIHLPKINPPINATGVPKPKRKTHKTVMKKKIEINYELEYGTDSLEINPDLSKGKFVLVDDLLATGGTASAAEKLISKAGGEVVCFISLIELSFLKGRDVVRAPCESLIKYET